MLSMGALATVLGVLISIDPRVREQLEIVAKAETPELGSGIRTQIGDVAYVLYDAARTQSIDHAPLMIFVVCTTILVLFMWRS